MHPHVFQISSSDLTQTKADIDEALMSVGARIENGILSKRVFFNLSAGGEEVVVEFLGYSRYNQKPLFRAFRKSEPDRVERIDFNMDKNIVAAFQSC